MRSFSDAYEERRQLVARLHKEGKSEVEISEIIFGQWNVMTLNAVRQLLPEEGR